MGVPQKRRKHNRLILLYKGLKGKKQGYLQMTLFPRLGAAEISTLWYFRHSMKVQTPKDVASFLRLSGTGMPSLIV